MESSKPQFEDKAIKILLCWYKTMVINKNDKILYRVTLAVWVQINYVEVDVLNNTATALCPCFDSKACQKNLFIILILYINYHTHSTGNERICVSRIT
jgi:hypothetical protein